MNKRQNKKKQLSKREADAQRIKDVLTASKNLAKHLDSVMNIGGFQVKITDKQALQKLLDNEIVEISKYGLNEPSTYGPVTP